MLRIVMAQKLVLLIFFYWCPTQSISKCICVIFIQEDVSPSLHQIIVYDRA